MRLWRGAWVLALPLWLMAASSAAQSTGSSFGGGGFGGGGGGGSSGGGYSGGGGGYSGGGYSGGGYSGGGYSGGGGGYSGGGDGYSGGTWTSTSSSGGSLFGSALGFALLMLLAVAIHVARSKQVSRSRSYSPYRPTMDVSALSVAVDADARRRLQAALDEAAAQGDTSTPRGRRTLLAQVARLLLAERDRWLYVGGRDASPDAPSPAEATFRHITTDLRSRFRHELLRNIEGRTEAMASPNVTPQAREGEGVCVISVAVAARRNLFDLGPAPDRQRFEQALQLFASLTEEDLVAFEVIWSPSKDEDRMSTAELEVLYPEMKPMGGAMVGRIVCGHCSASYARELGRCPECGAPAAARSS